LSGIRPSHWKYIIFGNEEFFDANRISLRPKMLATPAHPPEFHTEQLEENYRT